MFIFFSKPLWYSILFVEWLHFRCEIETLFSFSSSYSLRQYMWTCRVSASISGSGRDIFQTGPIARQVFVFEIKFASNLNLSHGIKFAEYLPSNHSTNSNLWRAWLAILVRVFWDKILTLKQDSKFHAEIDLSHVSTFLAIYLFSTLVSSFFPKNLFNGLIWVWCIFIFDVQPYVRTNKKFEFSLFGFDLISVEWLLGKVLSFCPKSLFYGSIRVCSFIYTV